MKYIYLIRHGDKTKLNTHSSTIKEASELTYKGRLEAALTSHYFKDIEINLLYTSPLIRAVQTAEPIAELKGVELKLETSFRERILFTEDISDDEAKLRFDKSQKDWSFKSKGGESLIEVFIRFNRVFDEICTQLDYGNRAIIVSHGRAIQSFLHLKDNTLGLGDANLLIRNCSITVIEIDEMNEIQNIIANTTDHLNDSRL